MGILESQGFLLKMKFQNMNGKAIREESRRKSTGKTYHQFCTINYETNERPKIKLIDLTARMLTLALQNKIVTQFDPQEKRLVGNSPALS